MIKAILILSALALIELFVILGLVSVIKVQIQELDDIEALQPIEIDPYDDVTLQDIRREQAWKEAYGG